MFIESIFYKKLINHIYAAEKASDKRNDCLGGAPNSICDFPVP